ncbi:MAG: complex I subunit 5 family protein [Bacillota bacterium]
MLNSMVLLPIIIPIIGSMLFLKAHSLSDNIKSLLLTGTVVLTFLSTLIFYPIVNSGGSLNFNLDSVMLMGISFKIDILSFFLAALVSLVWVFITVYSSEYMEHDQGKNRFHIFLLLNLSGAMGFFYSGDIITMFLFFELLTIFSYILVVHKENEEALRAGNRYIFLSLIGGLGFLFSIIVTHISGFSLSFTGGGGVDEPSLLINIAFFVYMIGFSIKAGIFPFHIWLPVAHPSAPSPASALLSGIMIKTGAFGMIRVIYNIYSVEFIQQMGWNNILLVISALTIFLGSAAAIFENDIKRRLAYSSIGQMGYIFLGIFLLNEASLIGNIFHIASHAVMKSCLFLAAGIIIHETGKRKIEELKGIGRQMPVTMISFTLAALAMIGIPPFTGFITKWELSMGALAAGYPYYVGLLLLSSLMNGIYYFPIIVNAFFASPEEEPEAEMSVENVSWKMLVPVSTLALGTFIFDIIPFNIPLEMAQRAALLLLGN